MDWIIIGLGGVLGAALGAVILLGWNLRRNVVLLETAGQKLTAGRDRLDADRLEFEREKVATRQQLLAEAEEFVRARNAYLAAQQRELARTAEACSKRLEAFRRLGLPLDAEFALAQMLERGIAASRAADAPAGQALATMGKQYGRIAEITESAGARIELRNLTAETKRLMEERCAGMAEERQRFEAILASHFRHLPQAARDGMVRSLEELQVMFQMALQQVQLAGERSEERDGLLQATLAQARASATFLRINQTLRGLMEPLTGKTPPATSAAN